MVPETPNHAWLEHLPLPVGVIRTGRFAYANAALAELLGTTREAMTNLEFFAPVSARVTAAASAATPSPTPMSSTWCAPTANAGASRSG